MSKREWRLHEYFDIDEDIIWDVVYKKIPELKPEVEAILKEIVDHTKNTKK